MRGPRGRGLATAAALGGPAQAPPTPRATSLAARSACGLRPYPQKITHNVAVGPPRGPFWGSETKLCVIFCAPHE